MRQGITSIGITILLTLLTVVLVVGCSNNTKAGSEAATYYESVDERGTSTIIKLVDKETGCKYLIVKSSSSGRTSTVQMIDSDGKPLCK